MSGRLALRDALDGHAQRAIERHRVLHRATVTKLSPLTIDVHGSEIALTLDDDFEVSQWMQFYRQSVKLRVGDLVLVHQEGHDWTLVDAVSDTSMPTTFGSSAASSQVTSPYTITTGYTVDRAFNPVATSLGEVATVLATLIDDMKTAGLIKGP